MDIAIVKELLTLKAHKEKNLYQWLLNHAIQFTKAEGGFIYINNENNQEYEKIEMGTIQKKQLYTFEIAFNRNNKHYGSMTLYKTKYFTEQMKDSLKTLVYIVIERLENIKIEQALIKSERIFKLTFEQVGTGICKTDTKGVILDANHKFCDLIGYTKEEAIGLSINDITYPDDLLRNRHFKKKLLEGLSSHFSMEKRYIRKDGQLIWVYTTVTLMSDDAFENIFLIGIVQDISKQKEAENLLLQHNEKLEKLVKKRTEELENLNQRLRKAAQLDPLTHLFNRQYLLEKLEIEIQRYQRNNTPFTIVIMDIDHFKSINDQYGHNCGDEVLLELSKVISNEIRIMDILARWGGEEFLLLLPATDEQGAFQLSERIRQRIEDKNLIYECKNLSITITMGICEYSEDTTAKELIKKADQALYNGKSHGRNTVVIWKP